MAYRSISIFSSTIVRLLALQFSHSRINYPTIIIIKYMSVPTHTMPYHQCHHLVSFHIFLFYIRENKFGKRHDASVCAVREKEKERVTTVKETIILIDANQNTDTAYIKNCRCIWMLWHSAKRSHLYNTRDGNVIVIAIYIQTNKNNKYSSRRCMVRIFYYSLTFRRWLCRKS